MKALHDFPLPLESRSPSLWRPKMHWSFPSHLTSVTLTNTTLSITWLCITFPLYISPRAWKQGLTSELSPSDGPLTWALTPRDSRSMLPWLLSVFWNATLLVFLWILYSETQSSLKACPRSSSYSISLHNMSHHCPVLGVFSDIHIYSLFTQTVNFMKPTVCWAEGRFSAQQNIS